MSKMELMRKRQEKLRQRMKQRGIEAKTAPAAPAPSAASSAGPSEDPTQMSAANKKLIQDALLLLLCSPRLILPMQSSTICHKLLRQKAAQERPQQKKTTGPKGKTGKRAKAGSKKIRAVAASAPAHKPDAKDNPPAKGLLQLCRTPDALLTGKVDIQLLPFINDMLKDLEGKYVLKLETIVYRAHAAALSGPPPCSQLLVTRVVGQHAAFQEVRKLHALPPPHTNAPSPRPNKTLGPLSPGSKHAGSKRPLPTLQPLAASSRSLAHAQHGGPEKRARKELAREQPAGASRVGADLSAGGPDMLTDLLNAPSAGEVKRKIQDSKIQELLSGKTTKEKHTEDKYKSREGSMTVLAYCEDVTMAKCRQKRARCNRVHYHKVVTPGLTDESLGNCSYLDACRHKAKCRAVHYEIDYHNLRQLKEHLGLRLAAQHKESPGITRKKYPPQFVKCDVRTFPFSILGDFTVIMADPPWDIHMELPYGTLTDQEMLDLDVGSLSKAGVIALWVTGRALDHGRKCMEKWGYKLCGELLWVKTNQLQRLTRTGRTGHWMNHSKEHCLLGIKGDPMIQRNLDCDVICAEVRETSRKPDEIYGLLERLAPNGRYLEIFGRPHNTRDGWVTLGNQNFHTQLAEPDMVERFKEIYPGVEFKDLSKEAQAAMDKAKAETSEKAD
eukprot:g60389.t1